MIERELGELYQVPKSRVLRFRMKTFINIDGVMTEVKEIE